MSPRSASRARPAAPPALTRLEQLCTLARRHAPLRTAVVHPVDPVSLLGAIEASRAGLIHPVFIGPEIGTQT